jgi:hypothetical protein
MTIPRSAAEVLTTHVTLEVECIDRMYLNVYVPKLQYVGGVVGFLGNHPGHQIASSALLEPISQQFIGGLYRFARDNHVPVIAFEKGQRKDDVAHEFLAELEGDEGVLFIGRAQEKAPVFRTEKHRRVGANSRLQGLHGLEPAGSGLLTGRSSHRLAHRATCTRARRQGVRRP